MDKIKYYQYLDGIKLCIDSSCNILSLPTPAEPCVEHEVLQRSARATIRKANIKLREIVFADIEDNEEV